MHSPPRVLELFAGIGGLSTAIGNHHVVAAIDINTDAARVYRANFQAPYLCREIDSVSDAEFQSWQADVWWFSAPCQPYTRRGHRRDQHDRRAFAMERVLSALEVAKPNMIGLENVLGFAASQSWVRLQQWLNRAGYHWQCISLCPSQLGLPNRRPRFYMIASQNPMQRWKSFPKLNERLQDSVLPLDCSSKTRHLWLEPDQLSSRVDKMDIVSVDWNRITACFASSYGKTWLHAGSYLATGSGIRRFSPREVARLLGFPDAFELPALADEVDRSDRKLWKLLGNSLSIPCTQYVMEHLWGTNRE